MPIGKRSLLAWSAVAAAFSQIVFGKECTVGAPSGGDDTPQIMDALDACASGGTITIPSGEYQLLTPVNKEGLENIVIDLQGSLVLPESIEDQKAPATKNWIWLEGKGVTFRGSTKDDGGVIDGKGQAWYDSQELDNRFALLGLQLQDSAISNLKLKQPCNNFFNVRKSSNVNFTDLTLTAESSNADKPPHNTDGFDLTDSTQLNFKSIDIYNQDDCIAFKNGTTFVTADDVYCNGGHGYSVGSLGKGGSFSVISDIKMTRMTCENCYAVAQIKYYPAGSTGYVRNFICEDFTVKNVRMPIWINSHYPCKSADFTNDGGCNGYPKPSKIQVSNVQFSGFSGTTDGSYGQTVAVVECPYGTDCTEVYIKDFNVSPPKGTPSYVCNNIDNKDDLGIDCEITHEAAPKW
ncbi:pectin lyase fold/virulence factor [Syncephalastrum racemosum]|uniref:Pectin lyase fold/virulence factor n=1 Tax=Syncephalastrum racemosum TaxID=13706 RepID=A0A1X2HVD4_SYNRA|nr:pectin lyase fold/virulence factor [Syncephalastrum racemosum]